MNGNDKLTLIFGSSTNVAEVVESSSLTGANNTSLLNSHQPVVSTAGGSLLQAMNASDVRMDKVAALKSAIENGTYSVSSQAIAQKLISSMLGRG